MEQHPIPQDITGFKFKLVGDMTLQQFGYLAGGAFLAYVSSLFGLPFIFKWLLIIFFGFSGFALAFLPIEERPLDRWIISFIKAIYSPTQYLWKKKEVYPDFFTTSYKPQAPSSPEVSTYFGEKQTFSLYSSIASFQKTNLDLIEEKFLSNLSNLSEESFYDNLKKTLFPQPSQITQKSLSSQDEDKNKEESKPFFPSGFKIVAGKIVKETVSPTSPSPIPLTPVVPSKSPPPPSSPLENLKSKNELLEKQAKDLKEEMLKIKQAAVFTVEDLNKLKLLAQKVAEIEKEKAKAEEEILRLRRLLEEKNTIQVKPVLEEEVVKKTPRVKFIPQKQAVSAGLPNPPQFPNIVCGLVTSQKGEILPGVIVVIKDKNDNPVRAVKTNKLGHFSISTPLQNGIYTLELEKEGYNFDIIEIEVKGDIIPPIGIKAK